MEIVEGKVMGFCPGVSKAVDIAFNVDAPDVYSYGKLIHNNSVINRLNEKGVRTLSAGDELPKKGAIIIRAHGVAPAVKQSFLDRGLKVIDATCPKVLRSQKLAELATKDGKSVIIVGRKNHSEVLAIAGCASDCYIVSDENEAKKIRLKKDCIIISQTTINNLQYYKICDIIKANNCGFSIEIKNCICSATRQRQEALLELIKECDAIVVIGGEDSSNTRELFFTAKNSGKPSWHIEDESGVTEEMKKFKKLGLTSGASTPDWVIDKVKETLLRG